MSVSRNIAVVFVGSEEQVPTVDWYMLFSQRFLKGFSKGKDKPDYQLLVNTY
jgi:hypothetical protein